jgi:hypothetical protein
MSYFLQCLCPEGGEVWRGRWRQCVYSTKTLHLYLHDKQKKILYELQVILPIKHRESKRGTGHVVFVHYTVRE